MQGANAPDIATLPRLAEVSLRVIENLASLGQVEVPATNKFGDHMPLTILAGAVIFTGAAALHEAGSQLYGGSLRNRAISAQGELLSRLEHGTLRWQIEEGSTLAFVADGDPMAKQIAKQKPGDIVQIANQPVPGAWVHMNNDASRQEVLTALDRANVGNAGELLFLPIKASHEFLPGDEDYDMTIGEMVHHIGAADQYCDVQGIPRKPVIVVTPEQRTETYQEARYSSDTTGMSEVTTDQRFARLADDREASIHTFDPNKIIGDKICEIAGGEPLVFFGTSKSSGKYKAGFFEELRDRSLGNSSSRPPTRVLYGLRDYTTVNEATPDDIPVVIDPAEVEHLVSKGVPRERIVVVPDELLRVVGPFLNGD